MSMVSRFRGSGWRARGAHLVYVAFTDEIEFGVMALYFVAIATVVAVPATGVLIFAWLCS